jgi:hypothetical protein
LRSTFTHTHVRVLPSCVCAVTAPFFYYFLYRVCWLRLMWTR